MDSYSTSNTNEHTVSKLQAGEPQFRKHDNVFVLLSFVVGFAFCEFVLFGGFGIGVPLFYAVFYPVAAVYLSRRHRVFSKPALLTFLPVFTLLLCFVLFDNGLLRAFNVIALWLCTLLNLLAMAGLESRPMFWAGTWFDILKATFYMPFHHIDKCVTAFNESFKSKSRRNVGIVLLTLLGISPVLILVLALLASSDAGFEIMLSRFRSLITAQIWEYIWKIIISAILTFPLFNLLYALRCEKRPEKNLLEGFILKLGGLHSLATSFGLSVFCFIYVVYIAIQADYFFSAMRGVLPVTFTYSEYARRGFFELVAVVCINFFLIAIAVIFTERQKGRLFKACRIPLLTLATCTLLLIITAASKMVMYMQNGGLTPLRVYTSWFMLLLGVLTLFIMLKIILPKFDFYRFSAVGAISLYLALNLINVDAMIAHYNINLYHQTGKLDTQVFYKLSDSAIPEIATLKGDEKYGTEVETLLNGRKAQQNFNYWQDFSFAKAASRQAMN